MIKLKKKEKQDIYSRIEKAYPFIGGSLLCILYKACSFITIGDITETLNAISNFSSILLGFLGAILALLFSFNKNPFVKYIMTDTFYKKKLEYFFKSSILSGFALVFCSIILLGNLSININLISFIEKILNNFHYLEIFLFMYFILSSYRVISFVLKCAFEQYDLQEDVYPEDQYTQKDITELREKYSVTTGTKR